MQNHASTLAAEFKLDAARVAATVALIDEGNTIPFIARYRKEATGSMDDQTLRALDERLSYLRKLDDQKETVHNSITEQGAMTPEIAAALEKAKTLAEVEDIYRPYKPKRKTRASIARARGLEPLAARLLEQRPEDEPALLARQYITEEVPDTEAALAGARDILAEGFSDSANLRATLRSLYNATALVESKAAKKDTDSVYSGYYDYSEPAAKMAGHRILAVDRGEREGFLKVSVTVDAARAVRLLTERTVKNDSPSAEQVRAAAEDAYVRLIHPSLEREVRAGLTERACEGAISVFSKNLRQLLLQRLFQLLLLQLPLFCLRRLFLPLLSYQLLPFQQPLFLLLFCRLQLSLLPLSYQLQPFQQPLSSQLLPWLFQQLQLPLSFLLQLQLLLPLPLSSSAPQRLPRLFSALRLRLWRLLLLLFSSRLQPLSSLLLPQL